MSTAPVSEAGIDRPVWQVVVIGVVALAVALGIGRFAFTPLLPLMLRAGSLDAAGGAEWAAANYAGYLLGALMASRFAADPGRGLELGLFGVALATLAVAGVDGPQGALAGALLRVAAGVFSAWALVCASSWCLAELARRGDVRPSAWVYSGVGLGILGAGLLAWLGGQQTAARLWAELGLVALAGAVVVCAGLRGRAVVTLPAGGGKARPRSAHARREERALLACYGSVGYGCILPATFLPAMAREQVDDPAVFGLAWPLFGLAATLSVALAARLLAHWPRRRLWALVQGAMALGTVCPLLSRTLASLALSAILVGGTFMVATMAGLQSGRERFPDNPTPVLARMTVAFALAQVLGPLVVRALAGSSWLGWNALDWSLAAATALLVLTAVWLSAGGEGA